MTRSTITGFAGFVLLVAAGAVSTPAQDVVEIVLQGSYFSEPATVQFLVAVQPDADNRLLRIEADSAEMFRASEISLNGVDEKRLHAFTFKNLSAGHYTLRASVWSSTEVRGTATRDMIVTGAGLR